MEVADSSVGRRREHAIRRNGICGRCMGKLSIAFICVWVLLFVLCLVSLLTCKFEVDIGIDSFQVEEKHPSVISLDAFESAQKEWKNMIEATGPDGGPAVIVHRGKRARELFEKYSHRVIPSRWHEKWKDMGDDFDNKLQLPEVAKHLGAKSRWIVLGFHDPDIAILNRSVRIKYWIPILES